MVYGHDVHSRAVCTIYVLSTPAVSLERGATLTPSCQYRVVVSTYLGCASQGEGCHADATLRTVVKRTLPPQATLVSLSLSVEKDETR
jgi:hypothetical protein